MEDLKVKLQQLGLSGREAEVYLALLHKSELAAPEVAKLTTITRTKSYEILQNLVKKGMCNERYKNGIKTFSSVEPEIALENLIATYAKELARVKSIADQIQEELVKLHKKNKEIIDPLDYIELLTDARQTRERWFIIQEQTKNGLLVFTKKPYIIPSEENIVEAAKLFKRGVQVKSIYEYDGLTTTEEKNNLIKSIEGYQIIGEDARIVKNLPMKMIISDDAISMLALNDPISFKPVSATTMIIKHPSMAISLKSVFETYWKEGITVDQFKEINKM